MNYLKICSALLLGFVLGVLFYPLRSHAQYGAKVVVQEVPSLVTSGTVVAQGSQIVGFSCIADRRGEADCYVASVK